MSLKTLINTHVEQSGGSLAHIVATVDSSDTSTITAEITYEAYERAWFLFIPYKRAVRRTIRARKTRFGGWKLDRFYGDGEFALDVFADIFETVLTELWYQSIEASYIAEYEADQFESEVLDQVVGAEFASDLVSASEVEEIVNESLDETAAEIADELSSGAYESPESYEDLSSSSIDIDPEPSTPVYEPAPAYEPPSRTYSAPEPTYSAPEPERSSSYSSGFSDSSSSSYDSGGSSDSGGGCD